MSVNLFSLLPDTIDQQHAKELRDLQSEVCSPSVWDTDDSHLQTLHHLGTSSTFRQDGSYQWLSTETMEDDDSSSFVEKFHILNNSEITVFFKMLQKTKAFCTTSSRDRFKIQGLIEIHVLILLTCTWKTIFYGGVSRMSSWVRWCWFSNGYFCRLNRLWLNQTDRWSLRSSCSISSVSFKEEQMNRKYVPTLLLTDALLRLIWLVEVSSITCQVFFESSSPNSFSRRRSRWSSMRYHLSGDVEEHR